MWGFFLQNQMPWGVLLATKRARTRIESEVVKAQNPWDVIFFVDG